MLSISLKASNGQNFKLGIDKGTWDQYHKKPYMSPCEFDNIHHHLHVKNQ